MSFGVHARKVRDTTLPYGRRVAALRSCVQLYRPEADQRRDGPMAYLRFRDLSAVARFVQIAAGAE
ncbi:hypothetical protein NE235_14725 [Actinoallomurus spadix]|uniref:Uncharacterized protein n=1 Tax=Actinoallomurus spadix TaxID=79912 RepID=A0ABN0WFB9_9ACTN|nr:hypothetical protein [Actinoallomurus spadix]MCO5987358.1 hypothetical protein [Actinoallomurus spadix]